MDAPLAFEPIRYFEGWADLHSIVRVERTRKLHDKVEYQVAYSFSSLPNDAPRVSATTRANWTIENGLHGVMDVTFAEDGSHLRVGNSPQNMVVLRHIALNLLKADSSKGSLRQKRYRAALDTTF